METVEARVAGVEEVGPDTAALSIETPPGFSAEPGQFILVRATVDGEAIGRHYTLSSPGVGETFEITVGVDDEGSLSGRLSRLEPGDTIRMEGPFGRVHYEGEDRLAVVAGGPGIGGGLGIAERAAADGGDVALVYRDAGFAHGDRLAALAAAGATVICVRDHLAEAVAVALDGREAFVIGFRDFVDEALSAVDAAGGDPDTAKVENFGPR